MEERQAGRPITEYKRALREGCVQLLDSASSIPAVSGQRNDTHRALEAELSSHLEDALSLCMKYIRDRFRF